MVKWIEARVQVSEAANERMLSLSYFQSGFLVDPIGRRTYIYARAGLLAAGGRVVANHPGVEKHRHAWGANVGPGQGPALVVAGVGHLATFNLHHQSFPTI